MYSSSTVYMLFSSPIWGKIFTQFESDDLGIFFRLGWLKNYPPPNQSFSARPSELRGGVVTMFKGIPEEQQWAQVKAAVQETSIAKL